MKGIVSDVPGGAGTASLFHFVQNEPGAQPNAGLVTITAQATASKVGPAVGVDSHSAEGQ